VSEQQSIAYICSDDQLRTALLVHKEHTLIQLYHFCYHPHIAAYCTLLLTRTNMLARTAQRTLLCAVAQNCGTIVQQPAVASQRIRNVVFNPLRLLLL
jgi:hypothetical protein